MSKVGGHNGEAGDPGGGRAATVHELEAARARHQESVARQTDHASGVETPDRSAALNMSRTFDLDGIDVPSPDEVLATVEESAAASRNADISAHRPTEERRSPSNKPGVQDVDSDEILRELEEHHRRGQAVVRPRAPRGSAELQASARRSAPRASRRTVRNDSASGSQHRSRRRRPTLVLGALVPLTIAAVAVALSNVGGTGAPATIQRNSSRPAAETTLFVSAKVFGTPHRPACRPSSALGSD
jgi:hypothetical protein